MTKKFKPIVIGMGGEGLSLAIAIAEMSHTYGLPLILKPPSENEFFNPLEKTNKMHYGMSIPMVMNIAEYVSNLDIAEEIESYCPAAHAQAYQGEYNQQAAKATKKRRKKNKAAGKARRQNRK